MEEAGQGRVPGAPWTVKELANFLRVHPDTVYKGVNGRVIKTVPGMGRKVLIPDSEARRLANGE